MKFRQMVSLLITPVAALVAAAIYLKMRMLRASDGRLSASERAMREDPMWYLAVMS